METHLHMQMAVDSRPLRVTFESRGQTQAVSSCSQVSPRQNEEEIVGRERRGNGAESQQGVGLGFLHVRPLLGAIFSIEHIFRRVSRVLGARARGQRMPLARLRVLHDQSGHLHDLQ